jgi:hypothetical protein
MEGVTQSTVTAGVKIRRRAYLGIPMEGEDHVALELVSETKERPPQVEDPENDDFATGGTK